MRQVLAYAKILAMRNPSRTYLLIEERLGKPLDRYVLKARGPEPRAAKSWEQIARELSEATQVHITSETLRLWFLDAERKRLAKARSAA